MARSPIPRRLGVQIAGEAHIGDRAFVMPTVWHVKNHRARLGFDGVTQRAIEGAIATDTIGIGQQIGIGILIRRLQRFRNRFGLGP